MGIFLRRVPTEGEIRDPRAATRTSISGPMWMHRMPTYDAAGAVDEALYANIYVYACARARAEDLASLPIRVGADPAKPKDFDPKHPIAKLLGPAPGRATLSLSARRLIAWSSIQYDITGRFSWEIAPPMADRRDNVPFELWPLPSSKLTPIVSDRPGEWFSKFEYTMDRGRPVTLSADQVMHAWRPAADNFRNAESLLAAARLNVSIATMQDRYDHAFLQNDARPAAVVVHEEFAKTTERDGFRRQFLATHRGPDNAGKVAFVEASPHGAEPKNALLVQTLGLSQRDAEFIERYENQIRAICVAFATPLSRLADSSRRTYANAERETLNYWRNAIKPQTTEFAEAITPELMSLIDDDKNVLWFDTTAVPELEPPMRWAVGDIPGLIKSKVITRNEARTSVYLAEVDGLDEFEEEPEPPVPAMIGPNQQPALPPGPPVDDDERSFGSLSAAAIAASWSDVLGRLTDRQIDGLQVRASGKRGRQARTQGQSLVTLHNEAFWQPHIEETWTLLLDQVYSAVVSARPDEVRYVYGSREHHAWSARMATALGARYTEKFQRALAHCTFDDISIAPPSVRVEDVRSLWANAQAVAYGQQVSLEAAEDVLTRFAAGQIDLGAALMDL